MAPARSGLRPSYRETATRHLFTALRQAQTPADRDRLIERLVTVNLPLCDGLAGRYANRGAEIDDLIQVARTALLLAIDRFQPQAGVSFASFAVPIQSGPALVAYMGIAMLLFATTYSLLMIPYLAMPAEITDSYHGRTQLMSFRVLFSSVGSTLGLGLGPMLLAAWGATRSGHARMALVIAGIAAVTLLLSVWLVRGAPRTERPAEPAPPLLAQMRSTLDNRPFLWLLAAKFIYFIVLAFTLTTFAYFTKHVLRTSDAWLGTFLLVQSLSVVGSQPIWLRVARTLGKQRGFMIAGACYGLAHLSWWLAGPDEPVALIFARAVAIGLAGGGTFLLTQSMLPDAIEYDHLRTGLRREGVFTGVFVFVEQAASALGVALIGFVLVAMGYVETTEGRLVTQPASAITGIYLCMSVLPFAFQVFALLAISRYDLTAERLATLRAALQR